MAAALFSYSSEWADSSLRGRDLKGVVFRMCSASSASLVRCRLSGADI
ncbi:MAG: pentapeptide repeat-containing protein [Pontiellaceae bacterium]|nr:pentapeptide repeat-containing protein [Pontiellaceae bacterium]